MKAPFIFPSFNLKSVEISDASLMESLKLLSDLYIQEGDS